MDNTKVETSEEVVKDIEDDAKNTAAPSTNKVEEIAQKESAKTQTKKEEEKKAGPNKSADAKSAEPKSEEKKPAEAPAKTVAKDDSKKVTSTTPKEAKQEKPKYPFTVSLCKPVDTFRGATTSLRGKPFGGSISVLECVDDKFYRVSFVRSGVGLSQCYMLCREVDKCHC